VDYEGELGVVLGPEPLKDVSEAEAMKHIYGFVIAHDVSGRFNQFEATVGNQWSLSKSFDTFRHPPPL
jgi:2-keto-4-pentenoate hydratase/2-oxohepta-3-ene-1,7-dioic acid hydratase in catechol pathway